MIKGKALSILSELLDIISDISLKSDFIASSILVTGLHRPAFLSSRTESGDSKIGLLSKFISILLGVFWIISILGDF